MAHTNSTTHYSLPQFTTTDKPAWLTDVNNAYVAIDTGIYNAKKAGDDAQADATQALSDAAAAQTKANTADGKAGGAVSSLSEAFLDSATYDVGDYVIYNNLLYVCHTAVTVPGAWTGSTNWSRTTIDDIVKGMKITDLADVSAGSASSGDILMKGASSWEAITPGWSTIAIDNFTADGLTASNNTDNTQIFDVTMTGFTPIGIIEYAFSGNYNSRFHAYRLEVSGNSAYVYYRAGTSETFTSTNLSIMIRVLYIKN